MINQQLERLGLSGVAAAVRSRKISAVEVTRYFLDRIGAFDEELVGFNHVGAHKALQQAQALDLNAASGQALGALAGVPLSIKDVVDVEGMPATGASASREGRLAGADAPIVARLKAAGAIIVGKANCHELSFGGPSFDLPSPPARNPWNVECFSGGSSSGSGVTVAAGLCLGSLGTDTAGSVRLPATLCGIFGLKPGHGVLPLDGIAPLAASMDAPGPLAATAADCRLLYSAMLGQTGGLEGETLSTLAGIRIGVPANWWGLDRYMDDDVASAWQAAIDTAAADGADIIELDLPEIDLVHAAGAVIMLAEAADTFGDAVRSDFDRYGEMFRGRILVGEAIMGADRDMARLVRGEIIARMSHVFSGIDGLLIPGALAPASKLGKVDKYYFLKDPIPNIVANLIGLPSLAFPTGLSRAGLPIGLQMIGAAGGEGRLLSIAERLSTVRLDWQPRPARYFR